MAERTGVIEVIDGMGEETWAVMSVR